MITRIEARNFKCLKYVDVRLRPFQVLVGPNGSGKSSLFEAVRFLSRLAVDGAESAITELSPNFSDLTWGRSGFAFRLAVEVRLDHETSPSSTWHVGRLEVEVGARTNDGRIGILRQRISLWRARESLPALAVTPRTIKNAATEDAALENPWVETDSATYQTVASGQSTEAEETNHFFLRSSSAPLGSVLRSVARSANLLRLEHGATSKPSPPIEAGRFTSDGSSLPWLVDSLQQLDSDRFQAWLAHARSAIRGLRGIRVIDRPEDRHRYLMLQYEDGLEVPSWMTSEGTLRFLAITILAFPNFAPPTILLEEPENAIHPLNIEAMMAPLSSSCDRQILLSTHSPTLVSVASIDDLLVFERTTEEGTRIVRGPDHPSLKHWRGEPSLRTLYASGAFG